MSPPLESLRARATNGLSGGASEIVVLRTGAETGGDHTEVEALFPPGTPPSPERVLTGHELRIEVQTGRLNVTVDGDTQPLRAGEALTIAADVPHCIAVAEGTGAARFLWRVRPALADQAELDRAFGLATS